MTTFKIFTVYLLIIFAGCIAFSCQTQKQWQNKGFERNWIDTTTRKVYDTIHFKGSSRDTLFYGSTDTLFLKDRNFTTTYFKDSVTHKIYLKTVVNNRDTVIVKEIHETTVKEAKYTWVDHIKALWFVWICLFALVVIALIYSLTKK